MALKLPIPEAPYFPSGGWNPDENGLSLIPSEATDLYNLRVLKSEVRTRAGSKRLGNLPSSNPILKYHRYKKPDGDELLFGFTKNSVYVYNSATDLWSNAFKNSTMNSCDATTDWLSGLTGPATATVRCEGSNSLVVTNAAGTIADATVLVSNTKAASWDCSGRTHISFYYMISEALNVKVQFFSDVGMTTLVESFDVALSAATEDFKEQVVKMGTPGNWTAIKAFRIIANGAQATAAFTFRIDYLCMVNRTANDMEHWETTDFEDSTEGATIIAAATNPPDPNDAEDDGAKRVLLFYDTSSAFFDNLSLYRKVSVGDEDTTKTGPAAASTVTQANVLSHSSDSGFVEITAGTFAIYTTELGTLATASAIAGSGGSGKYSLVPVDSSKILSGTNSWVAANGQTWSIQFLDGTYNGLKLYVSYTYKITVAYKPRFVIAFHNRVMLGSTYESTTYYPWRIRWTSVANIGLINEIDYADLVDADPSPIIGWGMLGYYLNVHKTEGIVKGSYIGGDSVFLFNTVWRSGTFAGNTILSYKGLQYFLGEDDVYVWDGSYRKSITLREDSNSYRIREKLFSTLNKSKINNCFSSLYEKYQEFWLWIVGSDETYPTHVFVYCMLTGVWYYFKHVQTCCTGQYHLNPDITIDELVGTIDDQGWRFDDSSMEGISDALVMSRYASASTQVMDDGVSTDEGYTDALGVWHTGTDIAVRLITRDFVYTQLPQMDRTERLVFEANGTTVNVSYSNFYRLNPLSFNLLTTITLTADWIERFYFPDAVGYHIRFCFESTGYISFRWFQPYAIITETTNI